MKPQDHSTGGRRVDLEAGGYSSEQHIPTCPAVGQAFVLIPVLMFLASKSKLSGFSVGSCCDKSFILWARMAPTTPRVVECMGLACSKSQ